MIPVHIDMFNIVRKKILEDTVWKISKRTCSSFERGESNDRKLETEPLEFVLLTI
jgi:hypothetical protein